MIHEMSQMYEDIFRERGLIPCDPIPDRNSIGRSFSIRPELGTGYCWVYFLNDSVSISIIDQTFHEDCLSEINQPEHLTLGYYESVSGEVLTPYRRMFPNTFHAHVGRRGTYRFLHHAGIPVRGISITMMPQYYESYLKKKYEMDYRNPLHAFSAIDGAADLQRLAAVFLQIKEYRGEGIAAKMFYEGKLEEALSLIFEYAENADHVAFVRPLPREDLDALLSVSSYIDEHYSADIPLDFLTKIACMSKSKLMNIFKETYHCSIYMYQQNRRMAHAEHLLKNSSIPIAEISALVGYKNQGSFSEAYKKVTGITPTDFRRQSCKYNYPCAKIP